jgi:hypothetical protein
MSFDEAPSGSSTASNFVYIHSKEHTWTPARVIQIDGETATVQVPIDVHLSTIGATKEETVKLSDYPSKVLPLQNVNQDGCLNEVEDMVDLPFLHEVRQNEGSRVLRIILGLQKLTRLLFAPRLRFSTI